MTSNRVELKDVYDSVCRITGLNISKKTRVEEYIVARGIYYKICYENIYIPKRGVSKVQTEIGSLVGRSRLDVRYCLIEVNEYLKDIVNKRLYDYVLSDLKLNNNTSLSVSEDLSDFSQTLLSVVNDLKGMNDDDIKVFHETRLKPFKKALESRIKPKVITEVAGAMLIR